MSSLASLVATHGNLQLGQGSVDKPDEAVRTAQYALSAAGYRIGTDGAFGPRTEQAVRRFELQHHLNVDGIINASVAVELDKPDTTLIAAATPLVHVSGFPHDDTASLLAFYGKPWEDSSLLTHVPMPFRLTYTEDNGRVLMVTSVVFHRKASDRLLAAYTAIWDLYGHDLGALDATRFTKFSGSYNYRPVRGSSRLSVHAFGAAVDHDAEDNPLGSTRNTIPMDIVACFTAQGFFWGGDYTGRRDNMHFQGAHE